MGGKVAAAISDRLSDIEKQLRRDPGSAEAEWRLVSVILARFPAEESAILRWLFSDYSGYNATRARAGALYLERDPVGGWSILERLVGSSNPDDRDTALTIVAETGDSRAAQLLRPLLADPYPHLRLEAAELLVTTWPVEVKRALQELLEHKEAWVREAAQRLLLEIERDTNRGEPGAR